MLSDYLSENGFVQNPANHCVYSKQTGKERAILIIWADDLIIAATNDDFLCVVKRTLAAKIQNERPRKTKTFLVLTLNRVKEL